MNAESFFVGTMSRNTVNHFCPDINDNMGKNPLLKRTVKEKNSG